MAAETFKTPNPEKEEPRTFSGLEHGALEPHGRVIFHIVLKRNETVNVP